MGASAQRTVIYGTRKRHNLDITPNLMSTKQDLTKEHCAKYPQASTRSLARALYKNYPKVFTTADAACDSVRWVRGRKDHNGNATPSPIKKVTMPASKTEAWESVVLGKGRYLILSDIHCPYHDEYALGAAVAFGKQYCPTHIILNGDILDFYSVSRFQKDPKKRDLAGELKYGLDMLKWIRAQFPECKITFKLGNHCERWQHYLWERAPELAGVEDFELDKLLKFKELKIDLVDHQRIIKLGKLFVMHGHELQKGLASPVNPARGVFTKTIETMLVAHHHRTSHHTEPTAGGRFIGCWSTGCLCELHPEYSRINKWNHGMATVTVVKSGDFTVDNRAITNGRVL